MDFRDSQFYKALSLLVLTFVISGFGYYILGLLSSDPETQWSLFDCFYMSSITLTTVGFGETLAGMESYTAARIYTMFLVIFGAGFLVYAVSAGTAFIVEGELQHLLEKRRMEKAIEKLSDHYIVCGAGSTGIYVIRELLDTGQPFVVVEMNHERIERIQQMGCKLIIEGDATNDESLVAAGIERARGMAVCMPDDRDNLFVTVTARQHNKDMRIVSRNQAPAAQPKLLQAGADATVSPNLIGGLRLVSELIRPSVTSFLDLMLRDKKANIRFAEVTVEAGSELDGKTIGEARIDQNPGLPVLALRSSESGEFHYEPDASTRIEPGLAIIVMGSLNRVQTLEAMARAR